MTSRRKKIAASLAAAVLALAVGLPMALGSGQQYPTIINPTKGAPFPQTTLSTGGVCPSSMQCNAKGTTTGTVTIKLASSPNDGDILAIIDADGNAAAHAITVQGNGNTIDGATTAAIGYSGGAFVARFSTLAGGWLTVEFGRALTASTSYLSVDLRPSPGSFAIDAGSIALAGDVTGPAGANTAIKINGTSVPSGGALTTGAVLRTTGLSSAAWGALDLSNTLATTGVLPVPRGVLSSVTLSALNVDWSTSYVFAKTLASGANAITFSSTSDGQTIVVALTGAASTVTWPSIKWPGGTAPTQTASGTDVYTFVDQNGTIYGSVVQDLK